MTQIVTHATSILNVIEQKLETVCIILYIIYKINVDLNLFQIIEVIHIMVIHQTFLNLLKMKKNIHVYTCIIPHNK